MTDALASRQGLFGEGDEPPDRIEEIPQEGKWRMWRTKSRGWCWLVQQSQMSAPWRPCSNPLGGQGIPRGQPISVERVRM